MIEIKLLSKNFGKYKALSSINLCINKGEITAIVGPNGSGKTSLIKSILDLIKIDSGSISINNYLLNGNPEYRKEIGYMPQIARYPENLSVKELLKMLKDFRNQKENLDEELIELLKMDIEMNKAIKNLSGGMRQKLSAIIAFLFNPKILIFDEPTSALDPISSSCLKDKIIKENQKGKTFILTSHNMNELEELTHNIIFMLEGKIQFVGTVENLFERSKEQNLERAVAFLMRNNSK